MWAIPPLLPFVFVAMIRLLWGMMGRPWAPDNIDAAFVVALGVSFSFISAVTVGLMQSEGCGIWWTFKEKGKSDD